MIKHMKMGQLGVGNTKKLNRSCWQQLTIDLKKKKKSQLCHCYSTLTLVD